jgi:hypothetical protein
MDRRGIDRRLISIGHVVRNTDGSHNTANPHVSIRFGGTRSAAAARRLLGSIILTVVGYSLE